MPSIRRRRYSLQVEISHVVGNVDVTVGMDGAESIYEVSVLFLENITFSLFLQSVETELQARLKSPV